MDDEHSNLVASWSRIGGGADWPDASQWDELAACDVLEDLEPVREIVTSDGQLELALELPMPAISLLELSPA